MTNSVAAPLNNGNTPKVVPTRFDSNPAILKRAATDLKLPAFVVIAVGTRPGFQLRHCLKEWSKMFGKIPPFVRVLNIDTTSQPKHSDVDILSDDRFVDLGEAEGATQRLSQAWQHEEYKHALSREECNHAVGKGAGQMPRICWFYVEENKHRLDEAFGALFRPFVGSSFAKTVEETGALLEGSGITVSKSLPAEVVFVGTTPGGTTAQSSKIARQLRCWLDQNNILANLSFVLTLPATDVPDGPDRTRIRQLTAARLTEAVDYATHTPIFEHTILAPEPTLAGLDAHDRNVGAMLATLALPLGKAFSDTIVNMHTNHRTAGPGGQIKCFDAYGYASLKVTPFRDVKKFAFLCIAREVFSTNESEKRPKARDFLSEHGVSLDGLGRNHIRVTTPDVPAWVDDNNEEVFLHGKRKELQAKAMRVAKTQLDTLTRAIQRVNKALPDELAQVVVNAGLTNATDFCADLIAELSQLKKELEYRAAAQSATAARSTSKVDDLRREIEREACLEVWKNARTVIEQMFDTVTELEQQYLDATDLFKSQWHNFNSEYEIHWEEASRTDACVIFDRESIRKRIQEDASQIIQRVSTIAVREKNPARLLEQIQSVLATDSGKYSRFERIDDARHIDPERFERAIERAIHAAEPRCRLDPFYDARRHSSDWLFIEGNEDAVSSIAGRIVPNHRAVPAAHNEWRFLRTRFAIEPGALVAAQEAHDALLTQSTTFPVFAEPGYEPATDLVRPRKEHLCAAAAIPIHLQLKTGRILFDRLGGYSYINGQKRVALGATRGDAWKALMEDDQSVRESHLPILTDLVQLTESDLLGRPQEDVIDVLQEIEQKLTRHLAGGGIDDKKFLALERAAVRDLRRKYVIQLDASKLAHDIWGVDESSADSAESK